MRTPLLALAALSLITGCSRTNAPPAAPPHWLRVSAGNGDPGSLNIHLDPSAVTDDVAELSQAYFVRYDRAGHPLPELITTIPTQANGGISRDGRTITWHLRHGVRWSDGAPFSSSDVAFTVKAINDKRNLEAQGTLGWDLIERVETPDPYTAIFRLKQRNGGFLPLYFGTAANEPCILPKHLLGSLATINTAAYNSKPVGIGPFRVTAWRRNDAVELERNPFYFRGAPKLERITIKLLGSQETLANQMQTGEVDLWPLMPPSYGERMRDVRTLHVETVPNYRATQLDFVATRPLVSDLRVRRAIAYGIDRRRLVATVLHGFGSLHDGPIIPIGAHPFDEPVVPYDPERAAALLDDAGWKRSGDGIRTRNGTPLRLDVVFPAGSPELDQTIEFLRGQMSGLGIDLVTRKFAPNVFRAPMSEGGVLYNGKFDFSVYPRTLMAVSDVALTYGCRTIPPNGMNGMRFCDREVDRLLDRVEDSYDESERARLFAAAHARIVSLMPTVSLYVWKGGYAWNKRVTGFDPPVLTPFDDMMNVDVR